MAAVAAAVVALAMPSAAHADEEPSNDYTFPGSASTHFYDLSLTRYWGLPSGTPYVTVLNTTDVLVLDWDGEVTRVNVDNGTPTALGSLPVPAGARVLDVVKADELPQSAGRATVLVSYSGDDGSGSCTRLVAREATIDLASGGTSTFGKIWYQSPCMALDVDAKPTPLAMSGGRIVVVPKAWRADAKKLELFLSVGGFGVAPADEGKLPKAMRPQLHSVLLVSAPQTSSVYATGFRNIQGMTIATIDGRTELVTTEHGPRGGDEINIVKKGVDYGWPKVSYGTTYAVGRAADTPVKAGTTAGYPAPLFAWVPSIAPTSVVQVKGSTFSRWWTNGAKKAEGDLIMSAMGAQHLVRMRVDDGGVRYYESIPVGARIRTLVQMPNGVLVGGVDQGSDLVVIRPTGMWTVLK